MSSIVLNSFFCAGKWLASWFFGVEVEDWIELVWRLTLTSFFSHKSFSYTTNAIQLALPVISALKYYTICLALHCTNIHMHSLKECVWSVFFAANISHIAVQQETSLVQLGSKCLLLIYYYLLLVSVLLRLDLFPHVSGLLRLAACLWTDLLVLAACLQSFFSAICWSDSLLLLGGHDFCTTVVWLFSS